MFQCYRKKGDEMQAYKDFVSTAIQGFSPNEAEKILTNHRSEILTTARELSADLEMPLDIFRGILLERSEARKVIKNGKLKPHQTAQYLSFSIDPMVAVMFADINSQMSAPIKMHNPRMDQGYIIHHTVTDPSEILFFYGWWDEVLGNELTHFKRQAEVIILPKNRYFNAEKTY